MKVNCFAMIYYLLIFTPRCPPRSRWTAQS
nr:MAG TPA: hypothetical protein [Caudoviricetes sp.]